MNKTKLQKDFDKKLEAEVKTAVGKLEQDYTDYKIQLDAQFNRDIALEKEKLRIEFSKPEEPLKNDLNEKEPSETVEITIKPEIPETPIYSTIQKMLTRNIRYFANFAIASATVYLASRSTILSGIFNSYVTPENVELFVVGSTTVIAGGLHSAMEFLRDRYAKVNGVKDYNHLLYKFPFGLL